MSTNCTDKLITQLFENPPQYASCTVVSCCMFYVVTTQKMYLCFLGGVWVVRSGRLEQICLFLLLPGCSEPLGMKSGHVQDYQVTASSIFRTLNMDMFTWEPGKARLDKQGKVNAWTAGHSDQSQWLQVRCYLC